VWPAIAMDYWQVHCRFLRAEATLDVGSERNLERWLRWVLLALAHAGLCFLYLLLLLIGADLTRW